ncbi:MAG: esterase-like activity of phytase family protein [Coleofasciculaceae cyanobacterium RL_1_1]|nr:esterase-like activity of phytase family protein [Coleofasciculaceae cyanobacterium RL_1_1]
MTREPDAIWCYRTIAAQGGPARFYDLDIDLDREAGTIQRVSIGDVHRLSAANQMLYPTGAIDPEGLAITPDNTLFISSEGDADRGIAPFIAEFDRTGQHLRDLPLYDYFIPDTVIESGTSTTIGEAANRDVTDDRAQTLGVQNNAGFESLTIGGRGSGEPYRVSLRRNHRSYKTCPISISPPVPTPDRASDPSTPSTPSHTAYSRFIHYSVIDRDRTQIVAEHLYPLDPPPLGATTIGLTELLAIDHPGYFLSLERAYGPLGLFAKIYQVALGGASDTASLANLSGDLNGIEPIRKRLLFDFSSLQQPIDNLEGMTFGPRLADGSQSVIIISDDNFNPDQTTQIWLFRLSELSKSAQR